MPAVRWHRWPVAAVGGVTGGSGGNAAGRPQVVEAGAAAQQKELPFTGSDVPLIVFAGAAAIAAGALLRRRIDGAAH